MAGGKASNGTKPLLIVPFFSFSFFTMASAD